MCLSASFKLKIISCTNLPWIPQTVRSGFAGIQRCQCFLLLRVSRARQPYLSHLLSCQQCMWGVCCWLAWLRPARCARPDIPLACIDLKLLLHQQNGSTSQHGRAPANQLHAHASVSKAVHMHGWLRQRFHVFTQNEDM